MSRMHRQMLAIGSLALALALGAAPVRSDTSHEALRAGVAAGEIVPLTQLLDWLDQRYQGHVIEVELETEDDVLVYNIERLGPDGQIVEFHFDARSGELLRIEGVRIEDMRKP